VRTEAWMLIPLRAPRMMPAPRSCVVIETPWSAIAPVAAFQD
jgi:hypothetical protein